MRPKYLLLILVIITVIASTFSIGCISNDSSSVKKQYPQPSPTITHFDRSLSSAALLINDLPHGWLQPEQPINDEKIYSTRFVNLDGSVGLVLDFVMMRSESPDVAKRLLSDTKNNITDTRVDAFNIGDESYGFQRISTSVITFRRADIIVVLKTETYPPYPLYQLQSYAKIVDNRIISK